MDELEALYTRYYRGVYLYTKSLTHDAHLAEDITADTFLKAISSIGSFRGECDLRIWLCQIAKNQYKRIRWDYEGNVLLQGGCDLEVTFESGSGSICWDGEGIDPELIEAFTVVSWNDAKLLLAESNTRAFVEGEEIEFDTRDRCLLFVTAWGGEQVDWADHIILR